MRRSDYAGLSGFFFGVAFCLMIAWALSGCSPAMTYDEMVEVSKSPEVTDEQREKLQRRIERFETAADEAARFYENKSACLVANGYLWLCRDGESAAGKKLVFHSTEQMVRAYRRDKFNCRCVTEKQMNEWMRRSPR